VSSANVTTSGRIFERFACILLFLVLAIRDFTEAAAIAVPESWTASYDPMVVKDGIDSMDEGPKERIGSRHASSCNPCQVCNLSYTNRTTGCSAGLRNIQHQDAALPFDAKARRSSAPYHNSSACFEGTGG
jgi:hypothetical protein